MKIFFEFIDFFYLFFFLLREIVYRRSLGYYSKRTGFDIEILRKNYIPSFFNFFILNLSKNKFFGSSKMPESIFCLFSILSDDSNAIYFFRNKYSILNYNNFINFDKKHVSISFSKFTWFFIVNIVLISAIVLSTNNSEVILKLKYFLNEHSLFVNILCFAVFFIVSTMITTLIKEFFIDFFHKNKKVLFENLNEIKCSTFCKNFMKNLCFNLSYNNIGKGGAFDNLSFEIIWKGQVFKFNTNKDYYNNYRLFNYFCKKEKIDFLSIDKEQWLLFLINFEHRLFLEK